MWSALRPPGRLALLNGERRLLRAFHHELAYDAVHEERGAVLWADGEHGFNPYDFAELNLVRGHEAEAGADRVLIKRCMTPFQWDAVLTKHLDRKLHEVEASLVLAAPYDSLFSSDETQDWEQEDYVAFSLDHLAGLAKRHGVPVLLSVDMAKWWRTHPTLAQKTYEAVHARWTIHRSAGRWRAAPEGAEVLVAPDPERRLTLDAFVQEELVVPPLRPSSRRAEPGATPRRP